MPTPRVFISHASQDKVAVTTLAVALRDRGIDVWLDGWEIAPGDDIVASINDGLEQATAGLIVFSEHTRASRWIAQELSYLTYARIQEGKALIPVVLGEDFLIPPLLRPLLYCHIDRVDAIADAVLGRRAGPPPARPAEDGRQEQVLLSLRRDGSAGIQVKVQIGEQMYAAASFQALPRAVLEGQAAFRRGFRTGQRRDPPAAERDGLDASMVGLGRALRELCLPGDSTAALTDLINGCALGTVIEVCVEADTAELLGLPFEALRLPDDRLLATQPPVVMLRRPVDVQSSASEPLAGPLKILVAVGAPDEDQAGGPVLDLERELQNILDAVEPTDQILRPENVQVRILEVGHPEVIGAAIRADAYHVLHLSCHGLPGALELEDEDGRAVRVTADNLLDPLRRHGRPLPLVLLNACHTGVHAGQTASLAEALLRAGVPAVLAMLTSVSDLYATALAKAFYQRLAGRELLLPSRALAEARKQLERERQQAIQRGDSLDRTQPEYATASLFVAGTERKLADFGRDAQRLVFRPVRDLAGPVPQLLIGDLIGRRQELRATTRALRDGTRQYAGVVLTGLGGVGKSAVAGRAMQRLTEDGWLVVAQAGRFDLAAIGEALGSALLQSERPESRRRGELLASPALGDGVRSTLVAQTLAEDRVLLVLDDFEQNLDLGGSAFLDPDVAASLATLGQNARRGRLLLTCRYPVPGLERLFRRVAVGPLSPAETRKLLQRLPSLADVDRATLGTLLRVVGGHPRMLEFLDALLRNGEKERLPEVAERLQHLLTETGLVRPPAGASLADGLSAALLLGARDVLLEELLDLAQQEAIDEALLQVATSNLPVSPQGLARMLQEDPAADDAGDVPAAERALARLEALSLVHRFPDGTAWVHRWTAEGLARLADPAEHQARFVQAGRYRWWRVGAESHQLDDAIEAVRCFLAGRAFDEAVEVAGVCFDALRRFGQSTGIAALAAEILETLPESHPGFASVADEEARAQLALGYIDRALRRYQGLLNHYQRLAMAEPERADYQRDLSVSFNKMGDLYRALGQGEEARYYYEQDLAIAERLAAAEPERADYQRDLSVSYERMGDLYGALGQGEEARASYARSLAIRERLAAAEPERADYQRDLSISYDRLARLAGGHDTIEGRALFTQARDVLRRLRASGRLPDEEITRYLAQLEEQLGP